ENALALEGQKRAGNFCVFANLHCATFPQLRVYRQGKISLRSAVEVRMSADLEHLKDWVGRTQDIADLIAPDRVAAMAATLDLDTTPQPGDVLPPGWHWL